MTVKSDEGLPAVPRVPASPADLKALTPIFNEQEHRLYLQRLERLLSQSGPSAPRNIALTGSFGSGKSSVLDGLFEGRNVRQFKTIRISLSTISTARLEDSPEPERGRLVSNEIQKEIVKQILYRETPGRMSASRFRRIRKFGLARAAIFATVGIVLTVLVAFLAGRLPDYFLWSQSTPVGTITTTSVILSVVFVAFTFVLRAAHGRLRVKGLTAGPAQLELRDDESAFDRYIDEIVYFFEASRCKVAVFEDLDRFKRIEIYEELRSLNVLLNSSKQLKRPIRFIYAMRDSLFETIADLTEEARVDETTDSTGLANSALQVELRELVNSAADRAKFFDVVIPMVPFATKRTALDLWRRELPESSGVRLDALRIAAEHVQDMRLIRNITNEFFVFSEEISKNRIRVDSSSVFSLMLYKNVHLDDFEKIRVGASRLDSLESLRQDTITKTLLAWENLASETETNAERVALRFAAAAAEALRDQIALAYRTAGRTMPSVTFKVGTRVFESSEIGDLDFWRLLAGAGWDLRLIHNTNTPRETQMGLSELTTWIGQSPDDVAWSSSPSRSRPPTDRERLVRAELSDLLGETDLLNQQERTALRAAVKETAPSLLAVDLVDAGLIDQNFSLYVSRFYGEVVSAAAMNFVLHVAQKGRFSPFAELGERADVDAVLAVAGDNTLTTPSALNIDLFDLLADDPRLSASIGMIGSDENSLTFLGTYIEAGSRVETIIERIAGVWTGTFTYLAEADDRHSVRLMNSALKGAKSEVVYETNPAIRAFFAERAQEIPMLSEPMAAERIDAIIRLFTANQVNLTNLNSAGPDLRKALSERGLFEVSETNLNLALGRPENWALDRVSEPDVVERLVEDLDDYLAILPRSVQPITSQNAFPEVANKVFERGGEIGLRAVLSRVGKFEALSLADFTPAAWKSLVEERRVANSPRNILDYVRRHGSDQSISKLIASAKQAPPASDLDPAEARELATVLAHMDSLAVTKRVRYMKHLGVEVFTPTELPGVGGELFSHLVASNLTPDSADTFTALRDRGVEERVAFVRRSRAFAGYLNEIVLTDQEIRALFDSPTVKQKDKAAILRSRVSLPPALTAGSAEAIGRFLLAYSGRIPNYVFTFIARDRCAPQTMLRVLVKYAINHPLLTEVLGQMASPWKDLSGKDARKPLLPDWPATNQILERLKSAGVVTSFKTERGGVRAQVRRIG